MNIILTPEGTTDLLFEQSEKLHNIACVVKNRFSLSGYNLVNTPTLEYFDLFNDAKCNFDQSKMFVFASKNGRLVAMRADSTLPVARLITTKLKNLSEIYKICYIQPIFQSLNSLSGNNNETLQAGVELIGKSGLAGDIEIINMASSILGDFTNNFTIDIGHVGIYNRCVEKITGDYAVRTDIRAAVSSKNFVLLNNVLSELPQNEYSNLLKNLPNLFGGHEILTKAAELINDDEIKSILRYIDEIYNNCIALKPEMKIVIDLGMIHHNDYYTGMIFKTYIGETGREVITGGRYDNLMNEFGSQLNAVGFGMKLNELIDYVLTDVNNDSVIISAESKNIVNAIFLQKKYIAKGISATLLFDNNKTDVKKYAKTNNIKRIIYLSDKHEILEVQYD